MTNTDQHSSFSDDELVTLSWLATTALAPPSRVSNWRRRDPEFPLPAGGTEARPLFKRDELLEWGRRSGRFDPALATSERTNAERAMSFLNILRGPVATRDYLDATIAVFERLYGIEWPSMAPAKSGVFFMPGELDGVIAAARPIIEGVDPAELFDAILRQIASKGLGRDEHQTPVWLADFMADQVDGHAASVIDPAAGIGTLLLDGARALGADTVSGFDVNSAALRVLRLRATLAGTKVSVDERDILSDPPAPLPKADAVLLDPPFGIRYSGKDLFDDPRFAPYARGSLTGDSIWVLIALSHLLDGGTAVVHVNAATAHSPRERHVREELISSGVVTAVIELKDSLAPRSSVRADIWVLRAPTRTPSTTVRFVDARRVRHEELSRLIGNVLDLDEPSSTKFDYVDVNRLELIRADSVLTPTRWTGTQYSEHDATIDIQKAASALEQVRRDALILGEQPLTWTDPALAQPPVRTVTLRELRDRKMARRLRQVGDSRPAGELALEASLPVVTSRELREGFNALDAERVPISVANDQLRHGDVVFGEVGEKSRIKVWTSDEPWTLARGIGAYRLDTADLLPEYVAALLTSTQATAFNTGSVISRRNFDLVPLPLIPIERQREIVDALHGLHDAEGRAAGLARELAEVRHTLVDVAAAGYLSIAAPSA